MNHELLSRFDLLDKDVSLIKDELERMRREFRAELGQTRTEFWAELGQLRAEFREELRQLRLEINERFARVDERFDRVDVDRMLMQTRWLLGSLALIGTIISVLLAIGQFVR